MVSYGIAGTTGYLRISSTTTTNNITMAHATPIHSPDEEEVGRGWLNMAEVGVA